MKLLSLEVQGFRSFDAPQQLRFSEMPPGLYHVSGRNEVEPELEANGAGKSSLFEAVYWARFGKTSRGLKAGAVKNWTGKRQCSVILGTESAAGKIDMMRAWQPNALEVMEDGEPRPIDQPQLDTMLGMPAAQFSYCIYFAQFARAFVDLEASEQTVLFSSVLDLDVWMKAVDHALANARIHDKELQESKEDLAGLKGQAKVLLEQDHTAQEQAWGHGQAAKIKAAAQAHAQAKTAAQAADAEVAKHKAGSAEFRKHRAAVQAHEREIGRIDQVCASISRKIAGLQVKDIKKCPECGAPVSNDHIKKELVVAKAAQVDAEAEAKKIMAEHDRLLKRMAEFRSAEVKLIDANEKLSKATGELSGAAKHRDALKVEINPYTKMREDADKKGEQLVNNIDVLEEEIQGIEAQLKGCQYWAKTFKEIRLQEIHDSLAQLTVECNEALYALGLAEWTIEFDVERETASGSINKSFTTMVRSPANKAAVPWEAWSGGEAQRLRLATSLGFANLIAARCGIKPNVEMWDEPTQGLSDIGIQHMLEVFADRAQKHQKVILLADHRVLDFGGFAGTILVIKDKDGSRIEIK